MNRGEREDIGYLCLLPAILGVGSSFIFPEKEEIKPYNSEKEYSLRPNSRNQDSRRLYERRMMNGRR